MHQFPATIFLPSFLLQPSRVVEYHAGANQRTSTEGRSYDVPYVLKLWDYLACLDSQIIIIFFTSRAIIREARL
jgi:hypothetical protein